MKLVVFAILSLVVLMFIWLNGDSELEERLSGDAQEKSQEIAPSAGSSPKGIEGRPITVPLPGSALTIRVVDGVSSLVQEDCVVEIVALGRRLSANELLESIELSTSELKGLLKAVDAQNAFSDTLKVCPTDFDHEKLTVSHVQVKRLPQSRCVSLTITVERFAKLTVEIVGGEVIDSPWSCRVSLCPSIPEQLSEGKRRLYKHSRRMPQSYRKLWREGIDDDFVKTVDVESRVKSISMLVDQSGEFFVEAFLERKYRASAQLVILQTGTESRVSFLPEVLPVVAGILLDTEGNPVANQRLTIRGEGPLGRGKLFIPQEKGGAYGSSWDPAKLDVHFSVTTHAYSNERGEFETRISVTDWVSIEVYNKKKGWLARDFKVADYGTDLRGLVLRLKSRRQGMELVKVTSPNGEGLTRERVRLVRVGSKAGFYSPVSRIDRNGWLDTQWLKAGAEYRGIFKSHKFADFLFQCRAGVKIELRLN